MRQTGVCSAKLLLVAEFYDHHVVILQNAALCRVAGHGIHMFHSGLYLFRIGTFPLNSKALEETVDASVAVIISGLRVCVPGEEGLSHDVALYTGGVPGASLLPRNTTVPL